MYFNLCNMMNNYQNSIVYLRKKTDMAQLVYGDDSEQYCTHLEELVMFFSQAQLLPNIIQEVKKLLDLQIKIHGSENNEKVLHTYEQLVDFGLRTGDYLGALKLV